ncbi:hypothetical protein [Gluconobacter albidus]|uniref:Uncharacterized protein n=2 Tax=Gluconobacter albidus TaxID=318683 RepID=A0ABQ5WWW1_9PROT|nr:hypothetical protein [Gluconobacter albidus]AQS89751.1 hypothetical protein A0U94_00870 [Gluconobacter albidus]MBS1027150.1 hypothetical protein [Gluconobacter albidus]MCP1273607.1 hypothetical protein [Gluconobacter albidus]GBQ86408.1 hypothetical protein AA3250_1034 [Gluconobacter albidus NBRC 3250]GLQ68033.1 hypothetical protein GCM10007866_04810 [Gluconobacter albidus]
MRKTLLALGILFTTVAAYADPSMPGMDMSHMDMGGKSTMTMSSPKTQDPMAGLNMDQQMALCARLETLSKQNSPLTPKMKQQRAACQKMDMGMTSQSAPGETLDR